MISQPSQDKNTYNVEGVECLKYIRILEYKNIKIEGKL
jgi:hypothetical protein